MKIHTVAVATVGLVAAAAPSVVASHGEYADDTSVRRVLKGRGSATGTGTGGSKSKKGCSVYAFEGTFQYVAPSSGLTYTVTTACAPDGKCTRAEQSDGDACAYFSFFTADDVEYDDAKGMCCLGCSRDDNGSSSWPSWYDPSATDMPGTVNASPNPWFVAAYDTNVANGGYIPSVTNAACTYGADGFSGLWGFKSYVTDGGNQMESYFTANGSTFTGFGPAGAEVPRWERRVGACY